MFRLSFSQYEAWLFPTRHLLVTALRGPEAAY